MITNGVIQAQVELWFYFLLLSVIVQEIVILFLLQKEKAIVMNIFIIKKSIVN